jgi:hypothetical protein
MGNDLRTHGLLAILALLGGSFAAFGQTEMPVGIFHGSLLAGLAGDLNVKQTSGDILVCHYDAHTVLERDHKAARMSTLEVGEPVQVLADRKAGSRACYARIVEVVDPALELARAREKARAAKLAETRAAAQFTPRGDRDVAGVVVRCDGKTLTLRTRLGEQTLALRADTRFLRDGLRMDTVTVNARVSVRAGVDIYGVLQAYQVLWGGFDSP